MIITSFDNVPESLFDNAIILGLLAIITGFIFLIDIGCFNRREREKVSSQDKEYRMTRDTPVKPKQLTPTKEKPPKQNESVAQDKVISELRSSIKKKNTSNETSSPQKTENEKQTKAKDSNNVQHGRKHMENRGFSVPKKKPVDEHDNAYDYDEQSIRNYDSETSEDSDTPVRDRYESKSRGSQIGRSYILEEKRVSTRVISKDAETETDNHIVEIQSSKVTTTSPNKSDSQTSEESYESHPPASSSYLLSKNGKRFQPTLTTTRIERISQNAFDLNQQNSSSVPSSPQDPGYVLHTASKWPNATPVAAPQSFQQFKEKSKVLRPVHSVV